MSPLQYGTLKFIVNHKVSVDDVRGYSMITFWSLCKRGYVKREGELIVVTKDGAEAYERYIRAAPNFRLHEAEISERVKLLLKIRTLQAVKEAS